MNSHLNLKIVSEFKKYYDQGYITARDGNAAYKTGEGFVVTASGTVKNDLNFQLDFLEIDKELKLLKGSPMKPSIEAAAHVALLNESNKKVSVHVHSPNSVALAALFERGDFKPTTNNLVTVLNTKWPELCRYTKVGFIIDCWTPGSKLLHECIRSSMSYWDEEYSGDPDGPDFKMEEIKKWNDICIIQRHGVFAIGETLEECREHIERLEHVSGILLKVIAGSGGNLQVIL
jgi:ribulose-5-phosphate 4-epimerase/fuculose-1-phosphate aldolase